MPETWLDECLTIVGHEGLIADDASLLTYENDAFTLVRSAPQAVILPRDTAETSGVMRVLARHNIAVIPRGAGTSLAGGTVAIGGGVCIGTARMRDVMEINLRERWARVQAGVPNLALTRMIAGSGYQFAPDPSSQPVSTIGGNVATNAGGPHTLKLGVTTNHVLAVTMVMADGEIVSLGEAQRHEGTEAQREFSGSRLKARGSKRSAIAEDSAGYDLRALAVGSEGTLGVITECVVRLVRISDAVRTMLAVFETVDAAADTISEIIAAGIVPAALEMIDQLTLQAVETAFHFGFPMDAGAVLIIELDGISAALPSQAVRVVEICRRNKSREIREADTEEKRVELWKCRKKGFGAYGRYGKACCTQDGVVPRTKVPEIVRFIDAVSRKFGLMIPTMMHAGDGNIHPVLLYDEGDEQQVQAVLNASREIMTECVRLGGSVSGEHGIGIEKTELMHAMFSDADLAAQWAVRDVFDPERRCNPHKVLASGASCLEQMRPSGGVAV